VGKPEDAVQIGQELDFRILRIDAENKKIGLSARAAASEEPIIETKVYTSEAGGGMASLAELADFGKSSEDSDR
jgi:ribosomal protein S1